MLKEHFILVEHDHMPGQLQYSKQFSNRGLALKTRRPFSEESLHMTSSAVFEIKPTLCGSARPKDKGLVAEFLISVIVAKSADICHPHMRKKLKLFF
jgi:hypothetical protein